MRPGPAAALAAFALSACSSGPVADIGPIITAPVSFDDARAVFSAIADVPYTPDEQVQLAAIVESHNAVARPSLLVHLGDLKSQGLGDCTEDDYTLVAGLLRPSRIPVFILPGDNEWNDCVNPEEAWTWWTASFDAFDAGWPFEPSVTRQEGRTTNFSFVLESVLFVGLHLVGGRVHDEDEWTARHQADADWLDRSLAANPAADALIVLGHAAPSSDHDDFMERFKASAEAFGKPVLYLHGDGHRWIEDRPFGLDNLYRIQLDSGGVPPLMLGFDPAHEPPFIYERALFEVHAAD